MNRKVLTLLCATAPWMASLAAQDRAETLLVSFKSRSFDLTAFRQAIATGASVTEVDEITAGLDAAVQRDQAGFVTLVRRLGGRVTHQWWLVNGCAIEIEPEHLDAIRGHARVAQIEKNRYLQPGWIKTATNNKNHHTDGVHAAGVKGKGVAIAILDSGLDADMNKTKRPHRTFYLKGDPKNTGGGGLSGSRLLANIKVGLQPADDIIGHGTMVAAMAAGENWGTANGDAGHAPEASIVGYSIADQANGAAALTTMVSALQRMARDKVKYKIAVGNLAYEGSAVPSWIEQKALDSAALNADILISVIAGNRGTNTHWSHAATNVIAVGAANANVHTIPSFSSYGWIQPGRPFPDIVANGVNVIGPLFDNEKADRTKSGTSNAAPQVAGAAALYRSTKNASALETRAALLATTENIDYVNNGAKLKYGTGYLRDDQLIRVAKGAGMVQNSTLTPTTKTRTYQYNVKAGTFYAAALTWYRYDLSLNTGWSNLSLSVDMGSTNLAKSDYKLSSYEKVEFRPAQSGTVTITVKANSLEANRNLISFSLVAYDSLPFRTKVWGDARSFGTSCKGSLVVFGQNLPPTARITGTPTIGQSHTVAVSPTLPSTPVVIAFGISNTRWGGLNLPIDLTAAGAKGCSIYASLDVLFSLTASKQTSGYAFGTATKTIAIPYAPLLIGLRYYVQGAAADAKGNKLGMTTTNGLSILVGN